MRACLLCALLIFALVSPSIATYTSPPYFLLNVFTWNSTLVAPGVAVPNLNGPQATQSLKFGVADAYRIAGVLPNTQIVFNVFDEMLYPPLDVGTQLALLKRYNATLIVGNPLSDTSYFTGLVGGVYGIAQFSGSASATIFSNKYYFPYYTRLCTPFDVQAQVMADVVLYNYQQFGRGWENIAILLTSDTYGTGIYKEFTAILSSQIKVKTAQSILVDQTNFDLEFEQIKKTGARVIVGFLFAQWDDIALAAKAAGLIGPGYVWFGTDTLVGLPWQYFANGTVREDVSEAMRGFQATFMYVARTGPLWDSYINTWNNFPPGTVPGVGLPYTPPDYSVIYYDVGFFTALVIDQVDKMGLLSQPYIPPTIWTEVARNLSFVGASGNISINAIGDRDAPYTMWNYRPETNNWSPVGFWAGPGNYSETAPIYYQDNTTKAPDLDIRPPFSYWSCHDKEKGYDPTGKRIKIEKPGKDDVNYIDSTYICDGFIDCQNFSEESYSGCSTNYEAVFIAFGIVTGLLILMAIGFIIFVIIFGCCIPRKRVRAASPIFLLLVCFSGIVGYISTYAWYGKPQFVACNFQSWLLGLAVTCMLAALCSKNVRIWRIFLTPFKKVMISDLDLIILWAILVIPALIILGVWTLVSTPTADFEYREGEDHWVCTTGGFTGYPIGYVWFGILVAYQAVLIFFGLFLSVGTRNVPGLFNESRLIAISIYNIGFFGIVVIPIVIALTYINPFAGWIIRTAAILYGFTATLWLQFIPMIVGIVCIDRFGEYNQKMKIKSGDLLNQVKATNTLGDTNTNTSSVTMGGSS